MNHLIRLHNPSQSHWEMKQMLHILKQHNPERILEIGVHMGGSIKLWRDILGPSWLWGIDSNPITDFKNIITGKSQEPETYQKTRTLLDKKELDFLFIDGGHLYKEVSTDFLLYSTLVRSGGIIGFDDIILEGNHASEVYKFWNEIKKEYRHIEIWDGTPSGTGAGLIWMP